MTNGVESHCISLAPAFLWDSGLACSWLSSRCGRVRVQDLSHSSWRWPPKHPRAGAQLRRGHCYPAFSRCFKHDPVTWQWWNFIDILFDSVSLILEAFSYMCFLAWPCFVKPGWKPSKSALVAGDGQEAERTDGDASISPRRDASPRQPPLGSTCNLTDRKRLNSGHTT